MGLTDAVGIARHQGLRLWLGERLARLGREIANGENPERPNNEPPGPAIMEPLCRTARQRKGRYAITIIEKTTYSHCLRFFQQGVAPAQL